LRSAFIVILFRVQFGCQFGSIRHGRLSNPKSKATEPGGHALFAKPRSRPTMVFHNGLGTSIQYRNDPGKQDQWQQEGQGGNAKDNGRGCHKGHHHHDKDLVQTHSQFLGGPIVIEQVMTPHSEMQDGFVLLLFTHVDHAFEKPPLFQRVLDRLGFGKTQVRFGSKVGPRSGMRGVASLASLLRLLAFAHIKIPAFGILLMRVVLVPTLGTRTVRLTGRESHSFLCVV